MPRSGDKRKVTIAITSKGDGLIKRIPSLLHDRLSDKLIKFDDKTLQQLLESLELLVNILEINDLEAFSPITDSERFNDNTRQS